MDFPKPDSASPLKVWTAWPYSLLFADTGYHFLSFSEHQRESMTAFHFPFHHLRAEQPCLDQAECPQENIVTPSSQTMAAPGTLSSHHWDQSKPMHWFPSFHCIGWKLEFWAPNPPLAVGWLSFTIDCSQWVFCLSFWVGVGPLLSCTTHPCSHGRVETLIGC